jgi:hypothetical protein
VDLLGTDVLTVGSIALTQWVEDAALEGLLVVLAVLRLTQPLLRLLLRNKRLVEMGQS